MLSDNQEKIFIGLEEAKVEILNHFASFFSDHVNERRRLCGINFKQLSELYGVNLVKLFTTEEAREAIRSSDGDKSPESNAFNFIFIKECSYIIKKDLLPYLEEFDETFSRLD